jgi:hypothetical protein
MDEMIKLRTGEWSTRGVPGHRLAPLIALLFISTSLAGCFRPYSKSVFDPTDATFKGITTNWTKTSANEVRVLFVHGICTHTEDSWITKGWDVVIPGYFTSATFTGKELAQVGQVRLYDREYMIGKNTLSGRFLIWSPLTAADKSKLNFDNSPDYVDARGQFTWKRASLNATLKAQLLNDCLSDAVIYAGYRSTEIQSALQNAICAALDGTTSNNTCDFPAAYGHGSRKIFIVTESLGSRMVFDAISALKLEAERKGPNALAAFDEAVSPITQIFMLANQLPILALARPAPDSPDKPAGAAASPTPSMATALSVLSNARTRHHSRQQEKGESSTFESPIGLIAFTDPNDLLSYRIPPSDTAILGSGASVINVIASNADSYLGLVESPLPAHEAYNLNNDVLRLLFSGSSREKFQ